MVQTVTQIRHKAFRRQLRAWLAGGPTVGVLMDLCETNFALVARLVPDLLQIDGVHHSCRAGAAPLHLEVLERSRYTTLVRLTHLFDQDGRHDPDPDVRVRVYHDARQAEVVDLRQSVLPVVGRYDAPGLVEKWRANHFLCRWLQFCLSQGHSFAAAERPDQRDAAATEAVPA